MEWDRRRVERVHLSRPLAAQVGARRVFIIDISLRGFLIAHQQPFDTSDSFPMAFEWDGEGVVAHCRIVRTRLQQAGKAGFSRALYHSGLEIIGETPAVLRMLVEWHVVRALDEQKANAHGIPPMVAASVQTGNSTEFVRHEFIGGHWRESRTTEMHQPRLGFTIGADLSPAEVQLLRQSYEIGDAASREMLRRMAALSIGNPAGIPTRRYTP